MQEGHSRNTLENIRNALPLLAGLGDPDVVIITDAYHAPRARLIAHRLGLRATSSSPAISGANPPQFLKSALREIPAYLVALVRV